jgi:diguanylate cyclase (GGDEF)-like protein
MWNLYNSWRYYSYGREQYNKSMSKVFNSNLQSLRDCNKIVAIFVGCCSFIPIVFENDIRKAGIFLAVALIAFLLSAYTNYKMQVEFVNNQFIYTITVIFYANIVLLGVYIGVWSNPNALAASFLCILICALLMFINPPLFNLCLTLAAMFVFIVSTVAVKSYEIWVFDVIDTIIAGIISLYFNWHISRLRLGLEISTDMLEDDRNKYLDQSTTDELTQLRNRRDFMQTFQRYLSNYRSSDDWLCIAICDIDFFKNYNDHYGHPKGDECLRGVGRVLNSLRDLRVYSARVGGEEFAMLWFEQDVTHIKEVVSSTTNGISGLKIPHEKSKVSPFISLSIGIYVVRCGSSSEASTLYSLADQTLYTAKENGRNRAIIRGSEIEEFTITPPSN